jgi:hypothetical protein
LGNSGHWPEMALVFSVANDPTAKLALCDCGPSFHRLSYERRASR